MKLIDALSNEIKLELVKDALQNRIKVIEMSILSTKKDIEKAIKKKDEHSRAFNNGWKSAYELELHQLHEILEILL